MRTLQTYEDMVEKNWEALSMQGWHNVDAAARHYHENPGKLDRDLAAHVRASRRKSLRTTALARRRGRGTTNTSD